MANGRLGALLTAMVMASAAPALAQTLPGDVAAGQDLAQSACSSCHVVSRLPLWPPLSRAPSFAEIAREPRTTELWLRAFLQTPHARMPNLILSRRETDDVISYILSFKHP